MAAGVAIVMGVRHLKGEDEPLREDTGHQIKRKVSSLHYARGTCLLHYCPLVRGRMRIDAYLLSQQLGVPPLIVSTLSSGGWEQRRSGPYQYLIRECDTHPTVFDVSIPSDQAICSELLASLPEPSQKGCDHF